HNRLCQRTIPGGKRYKPDASTCTHTIARQHTDRYGEGEYNAECTQRGRHPVQSGRQLEERHQSRSAGQERQLVQHKVWQHNRLCQRTIPDCIIDFSQKRLQKMLILRSFLLRTSMFTIQPWSTTINQPMPVFAAFFVDIQVYYIYNRSKYTAKYLQILTIN
ncbi:MAG: hypothetical protein PWQ93_780, partial [Clostridiales bacterium]|nr:hypothetical protein [Clostridiales bacterium]